MRIDADTTTAGRPWNHLFHRVPRQQDKVYGPVDQAAFSEHSQRFLKEFDQRGESVSSTSSQVGNAVALMGGIGAVAGVALGGVTLIEGMLIAAIAGVAGAIIVPGAQVELSRRAQQDFLATAQAPYLLQSEGWLAADLTSINKPT